MDDITRLGGDADETVIAGAPKPARHDVTTLSTSNDATVMSHSSNDVTVLVGSATGAIPTLRLEPGQLLGHYRIERVLGKGGMGAVYAAEHVEHGRRVALKVLTGRFTGAEDRERFLHEGELAASINHKHTVYVFGSEDITGAPVIAMELLSGGTLRDRVQAKGALPTTEAVDLTLQIIEGLAAAEAAGILHRDIKPANCFIDAEGNVKVGDFGLSISTAAGTRSTGMFQGTPQYASPEQIRGEPLDVRSDIYSLGATLFYLLTGQAPFNDDDLTTLITRVTQETPRSPREMKAGVPEALAAIVTRCLSKDRTLRPASYAELEHELQPFSSVAPVPAPLGRRFAAGIADTVLYMLAVAPLNMYMTFMYGPETVSRYSPFHVVALITYFSLLEGVGDASLGKRLFGLRLIGVDGQRAGFPRALARAAMYNISGIVGLIPMAIVGPKGMAAYAVNSPGLAFTTAFASYVLLALLFVTARRRNGYAAIHDRLSGTRVVRRLTQTARTAVSLPANRAASAATAQGIGPFEITGSFGMIEGGELLMATDPRLKRQVWIHRQPPGAAVLQPVLRDMGRPGRLRWLGGRRADDDAWDAYEAFDGAPLGKLDRAQRWAVVRRWLQDLAREIEAGLADGSLTSMPMDVSRVWVTPEGHARLLDIEMPDLPKHASVESTFKSAQALLSAVAQKGLGEQLPALPLSARALLDELQHGRVSSPADLVSRLSVLTAQPDTVAGWRRAASIGMCAALQLILVFIGVLSGMVVQRMATTQPDVSAFGQALQRLDALAANTKPEAAREREALEIYIAGRFRPRIVDEAVWSNPVMMQGLRGHRPTAEGVLARHPSVTPDEMKAARDILGSFIAEQDKAIASQQRMGARGPSAIAGVMLTLGLVLSAILGVFFAFLLRSGLFLRAFGLAVVNRSGQRAGRFRSAWRALVAWAPAVVFGLLGLFYGLVMDPANWGRHPVMTATAVLCAIIFVGGAVMAVMRPTRGIQDRVAGTRIVPV